MNILSLGTGLDYQKLCNNHNYDCVDLLYDCNQESDLSHINLISEDVLSYLGNYNNKYYDEVVSDRFFEHVDFKLIPELLYLIKNILKPNGLLKFTVPNFLDVADKLNYFEKNIGKMLGKEFNRSMIDLHTELFNIPDDCHKSIWTPNLAVYYLKLEDFWTDIKIKHGISLDNRSWYMNVEARKNADK
jgi:hypothetical protein